MVAIPQEQHPLRMTETEYLEFERKSEIKHEFVRGEILAMTGGSVRHNLICTNISTSLMTQLKDKDCIVPSSDTRVKVDAVVSYRYPDVTVICDKVHYANNRVDTVTNPIVLFEVLSPSTAVIDYSQKLAEYIQISSLQEYVIVSQDSNKVERYTRQDSGEWLYTSVIGVDNTLILESIGCTLALADVYHKVGLTDSTDEDK